MSEMAERTHTYERYSVCPRDGEPLVTSLERRGCEWVCEACGGYYPMFGVPSEPGSAGLDARYDELREIGRARRAAASRQVEDNEPPEDIYFENPIGGY